jgi:formylglycine-generating enzyme required for sulfatase activity
MTSNLDCCASPLVPGGSFNRNNDPNYPGTISDFRLDKFEVTVGRFRAFVGAGMGTQKSPPVAWSGANPHIPYSGWDPSWNTALPADSTALQTVLSGNGCDVWGNAPVTWTAAPSSTDNRPINCVNWYVSFAFCIWDNGRLPTEAEWSYAASGGSEQRYWPWSNPASSQAYDSSYADYQGSSNPLPINPVGSFPKGDGKWGHSDLVGNVIETLLDQYFSPYLYSTCIDCAYLTGGGNGRALRGGGGGNSGWNFGGAWANNQRDYNSNPGLARNRIGFRCARDP